MTTWVIQHGEALAARDGRYLADSHKPLFIARFANDDDFDDTLHEGGISGVTQDDEQLQEDDQEHDQDNDHDNFNTDEIQ